MNFSLWLEINYPKMSKNSADTYQLIQKAKKNKRSIIIVTLLLVYVVTLYIASMLSAYVGAEFARGTSGLIIYITAFVFGSLFFVFFKNILIKKEIEKLLNT